jgi:RNA polymerase sigma-70 factor (ECF subfamily)
MAPRAVETMDQSLREGGCPLHDSVKLAEFEAALMPHLGAAYNLARWLTRHDHDAEDIVQEAYLRALRFFGGFQGQSGRAWLLKIVRNTHCTWAARQRPGEATVSLDEELHAAADVATAPEAALLRQADVELLRSALAELPTELREVVVLRELEELSYKEIAGIIDAPLGTVMSRLSRGRQRLQEIVQGHVARGGSG